MRVEGAVEKVSFEKSQEYFNSRPIESRISAILSPQSREVESLDEIRLKAQMMLKQENITMPENWGGYSVKPGYFEFWQGGASRLHDRIVYFLNNNEWKIKRLAP